MKKITKIFASVFALLLVCVGAIGLVGCDIFKDDKPSTAEFTLSEISEEVSRTFSEFSKVCASKFKALDDLIDGDTNPDHLSGQGYEHDLYGIYNGLGSIVDYQISLIDDIFAGALANDTEYANINIVNNGDGTCSLYGIDEEDDEDYIKIKLEYNPIFEINVLTCFMYDLTDGVETYVTSSQLVMGEGKFILTYKGLVGEEAGVSVVMEYVEKENGFYLIEFSEHINQLIEIDFDYTQNASTIMGTDVKWRITTTDTYTSIYKDGVSNDFLTGNDVKTYSAQ